MKTDHALGNILRWGIPLASIVILLLSSIWVSRSWDSGWSSINFPRQAYVQSVAWGPDGSLWIGGADEVNIFDGEEWSTMDVSGLFPDSNLVKVIAFDHRGRPWIGISGFSGPSEEMRQRYGAFKSHNGGIAILNDAKWIAYPEASYRLPSGGVNVISFDDEGRVWLGSDNGVSVFKNENALASGQSDLKLTQDNINVIAFDTRGNTWIGTRGYGLLIFDGQNWTSYSKANSGLLYDGVSAIAFDKQGRALIGTGFGLVMFDGAKWTELTTWRKASGIHMHADSLAVDSNGGILMSDRFDGLYIYDDNAWTHMNERNSALTSYHEIFFDQDDRLWILQNGRISTPNEYPPTPYPIPLVILRNYLFHPVAIWFPYFLLAIIWFAVLKHILPYVLAGLAPGLILLILGSGLPYDTPFGYQFNPVLAIIIFGALGGMAGGLRAKQTQKFRALPSLLTILGLVIGSLVALFLVVLMNWT